MDELAGNCGPFLPQYLTSAILDGLRQVDVIKIAELNALQIKPKAEEKVLSD